MAVKFFFKNGRLHVSSEGRHARRPCGLRLNIVNMVVLDFCDTVLSVGVVVNTFSRPWEDPHAGGV
jgi:hypothetical protein